MKEKSNDYGLLAKAYDYDDFEVQGKKLISHIANHLKSTLNEGAHATKWIEPTDELNYWQNYSFSGLDTFITDLFKHSIHLHNPKYMGHQVSAPAGLSILSSLISSTLNNGMAVYEMGQAATAIEKCVVELFSKKIGFSNGASGVMTSGGTLANLTALLAARQAMQGRDVWLDGVNRKAVILVSSQAHYSIDRAARVMGLGSVGVELVPVEKKSCNGYRVIKSFLSKMYRQ